MYDIKTRNSVLSLFNGIEVEKFPDESFELIKDKPGFDQIYRRYFPINKLVCNLFDIAEKRIKPNTTCIELVIFSCSEIDNIDTSSLKLIVNKLVELLGKDDSKLGEFTEEDALQFEKGSWVGRYWSTSLTKGVSLIINRNVDYFELHLTFLN